MAATTSTRAVRVVACLLAVAALLASVWSTAGRTTEPRASTSRAALSAGATGATVVPLGRSTAPGIGRAVVVTGAVGARAAHDVDAAPVVVVPGAGSDPQAVLPVGSWWPQPLLVLGERPRPPPPSYALLLPSGPSGRSPPAVAGT